MKNKLVHKSEASQFAPEQALAHELPYWDFSDDVVVLVDGSLVMGLELKGVAIETKSNEEINHLCVNLRSMLNSLPDGTEIGIRCERHRSSATTLQLHAEGRAASQNIKWISEVRTDILAQEIAAESILASTTHLYVYKRTVHSPGAKKRGFFSPPQRFVSAKKQEYLAAVSELAQSVDSVSGALQSLSIKCEPLTASEIQGHIYAFLNPSRSKSLSAPTISTVYKEQEFSAQQIQLAPDLAIPTPREQLGFSDLLCQYDALYYDGCYHRCISLKALPEQTHASLISALADLGFAHSVNIHIRVPDQSKELATLQAKRRMAHSMSLSQDGRPTDLESEAKLHSTEDLLRELIETGQRLFYFQCVVYIKAPSRAVLEYQTKAVLLKVRELNGAEAMIETVGTLKVWKSILPAGNLTMPRTKRIKTDNLADFLPVYEPYEGTKPVCLFRNRSNGLVGYDPFDPQLPNYNTLVTGSSGAGKSFVSNQILVQYLNQNPLLFIIDIGGSYRKLCELVGGHYIEFSQANNQALTRTINPFQLPKGETTPSARKIKFLLALLETILSDGEKGALPKIHKSQLEEMLVSLYEKTPTGQSPTLSHLANLLRQSEHKPLQDYASMLYPWTGSRPYGQMLDVQEGLDSDARFVAFDLKALSIYPDLQAVMLLIITDFILGKIDSYPDCRKQILMDECWELLKAPASQNFMEYCVRTLRKTGSGITFVTQGLEEIAASPIGPAILSNTATKFVLIQRGDLAPIQTLLKLNDHQMRLIGSLSQRKGHYSEALLVNNEDKAVIRIQPTPVEYWLATSDAADNAALNDYQKQNPDKTLAECIFEMATRYPAGIAEGTK